MKNKKLLILLSVVTVMAVTIIACKDNFNESDFLKLQSNLKTQQDSSKLNQQVKELNDAGKLLSFTVQVVDDRTPVQGAAVQISNDVSSSTGTSSVTTDANGNAVFPNVRVGNNTIIISKSGYVTSTAVVDFGALNTNYYQVVTGQNGAQNIVPLKQTKSVILPVFATGGTGNTGTITGKVTIENDLTNTTPEVPQNVTLVANFVQGLPGAVAGNGVNVLSYSFNSAGIGSAKVDNTTGLYSMVVPASAAGLSMSLLIPTIDGTIKMGANTIDSNPANGKAAPQLYGAAVINQPAQWGPLVAGYDNTIPSVAGVNAIFSTPTPSGAGLGFKFTAIPRVLSTDNVGHQPATWDSYNYNLNVANPANFDIGNSSYQLVSRGAGYTSSPAIAVPGVSDAVVRASLRGLLTSLAVSAGGSAYTAGNVTVSIQFKDSNGNPYTVTSFSCPVSVTSGAITAFLLPSTGTGLDVPFQTASVGNQGYDVASLQVAISGNTGTGATATPGFAMGGGSHTIGKHGHCKVDYCPFFCIHRWWCYNTGFFGVQGVPHTVDSIS